MHYSAKQRDARITNYSPLLTIPPNSLPQLHLFFYSFFVLDRDEVTVVVNYDNRFSCTGEKEKKGEMGGERKRSWGGERKRGESEVRQSSPDRIFIFDRLSGAVLWETPSSFFFFFFFSLFARASPRNGRKSRHQSDSHSKPTFCISMHQIANPDVLFSFCGKVVGKDTPDISQKSSQDFFTPVNTRSLSVMSEVVSSPFSLHPHVLRSLWSPYSWKKKLLVSVLDSPPFSLYIISYLKNILLSFLYVFYCLLFCLFIPVESLQTK